MTDAFGHWLAGFTDGEGSFIVKRSNVNGPRDRGDTWACEFRIKLRSDDRPILDAIAAELAVGHVRDTKGQHFSNPQSLYEVTRKGDCAVIEATFRRFPLRAKKAQDFELWCAARRAWVDLDWAAMREIAHSMKALREYQGVSGSGIAALTPYPATAIQKGRAA